MGARTWRTPAAINKALVPVPVGLSLRDRANNPHEKQSLSCSQHLVPQLGQQQHARGTASLTAHRPQTHRRWPHIHVRRYGVLFDEEPGLTWGRRSPGTSSLSCGPAESAVRCGKGSGRCHGHCGRRPQEGKRARCMAAQVDAHFTPPGLVCIVLSSCGGACGGMPRGDAICNIL